MGADAVPSLRCCEWRPGGGVYIARQARTVGLCGVLVAAGAAARVALLISPVGRLNADEAVVGLMADRMRSAHHVPLFFWGQYYGGTIEPMIVATLFGVYRSVLTMRAVALGLSLVGAGVVVAIGRQLFGDGRAWLAGALVAAWPGTMYVSIREFGFYWAQFVLVVVAVAVALRLLATAPAWPMADRSRTRPSVMQLGVLRRSARRVRDRRLVARANAIVVGCREGNR